jgi:RNA polymerase sigma-70 factor (ECF subfamily)
LDRELLLLKAQNYTYDEIASILSIENNQLKVKHHRAKQKLINLLKDVTHYEHA